MVLSGMVQTISSSNSSKTPFLGDVPLVGLFFSNKTSDKTRNEFIILVTPRPVFPVETNETPYGGDRLHLLQEKN
jgi:type II secretory pathway component GspD/PulD (secretin)